MTVSLRSAVVGAGFIGTVHARAIRAAGGEVSVVADPDARRARALAAAAGGSRRSASPEAAIAAGDVDIVHICTPNASHAPLVEAALAAGKHVVCEKPLATSSAAAARLEQLASKAGVAAAVPFVYRFYPMVREARARVLAGEAGRLSVIHGSYLQDWLARPQDSDWRVDAALGGRSRAFADIGVHWVDLVEFVSGQRITRLCAQLLTAFSSRAGDALVHTEDAATLQFATDGGAIGSLVLSQVANGRKNRLLLSLDGSESSVVFDHEQPDVLWLGGRERSVTIARAPEQLSPQARRYVQLPAGHPQGYQDCFNAFMADYHATIDGADVEGLPGFSDGRRAAEITEAVLASAARGEWVEL
ncbi:MAG: Gfo/Idh/MocA family oxidoreductase [Actinomycetota bacterium]|nr:Gfo/Idh/MocA family oxidoreductase [Actinomycetota bacterium]